METLEKINQEPKIPLEMYSIPGELAITERSLNRYKRDKKQDSLIKELVISKESKESSHIKLELPANTEEVFDFIEKALHDKDVRIQAKAIERAAKMDLEDWELAYLTRTALRSEDLAVWENAAGAVKSIYADKENLPLRAMVSQRIGQYLDSENIEAQKMAMQCVLSADKEDIPFLIKYGLESKNEEVQIEAARQVEYSGFENITSLVEMALSGPSIEVQKIVLEMMDKIPKSKVDTFIRIGLSSLDFEVQKKAILAIQYADKQLGLVRECLDNPDVRIQKKVMKVISYMSGRQQDSIHNQIKERLDTAWDSADLKMISDAVWLIEYLPQEEKRKALQRFIDQGFGTDVIRPELYDFESPSSEKVSRQSFAKTGSETTLLGGPLKDKVITRHITPKAFLVWQELYENYKLWKDAGFDYVPIEPVYSYGLGKKDLVNVQGGVLDISFQKWIDMDGYFYEEIKKEMEKIKNVLDGANIRHGHAHENNFCLRFFRDSEGNPVFTKPPRIYLIDFDQAVSRVTNPNNNV